MMGSAACWYRRDGLHGGRSPLFLEFHPGRGRAASARACRDWTLANPLAIIQPDLAWAAAGQTTSYFGWESARV